MDATCAILFVAARNTREPAGPSRETPSIESLRELTNCDTKKREKENNGIYVREAGRRSPFPRGIENDSNKQELRTPAAEI